MNTLRHTWFMILRQARNLQREPIWIALLLIQPLIWLLLYGQLFSRVTAVRGGASTYIAFLTPGVVCMNAFFGGTWSGMAMIQDLDRNVVSRFLASPVSRLSIVLSQIVRQGIVALIQGFILLLVALVLGVRLHGGAAGWIVVVVAAALLSMVFAGVSNGLALLLRKDASMIATANFVGLPLMFLSSILIAQTVMPNWMQEAARYNPLNWGVNAARNAAQGKDWGPTGTYLLLLAAALTVTTGFANWAFARYRRSL